MRLHPVALWMAVALAGCAQAPVVQSPAELRATHGFVHVSLGSGASARLRSRGSGTEYSVVPQADHGLHAHGLWVPAGEYDIVDLRQSDGMPYPPISVASGRITDLGGLVRLEIGNYEYVRLPIRHAELAPEVQKATQVLQPHLSSAAPTEWRPTVTPLAEKQQNPPTGLGLIGDLIMEYDRKVNRPPLIQQLKGLKTTDEFFRRATAALPPMTDEPGFDAEGKLYYGAELGHIRVRTPKGEWTSIDTGTRQTISAVEVSGRRIVAGTTRGAIRASDDGSTWRPVATLSPEESVVDIDRVGGRWIVLTARITAVGPSPAAAQVHTVDLIKVYSTAKDDLTGLALLREIPLPDKRFLIRGMGVRGQHGDGIYYVASGSELLKLDLATMQWSSASPGHRVDGHHISPKGLLTVYRQQGAFSKLQVSSDKGATWREADTPPYVFYDVYFDAAGSGRATRWSQGAFSVTIEFMKYDAAANRWEKTHDAPPGCLRVLRDADNIQRFCVTSGNSVLNYVDGKWAVEFGVN